MDTKKEEKPIKYHYRYACPACTNVAFFSEGKEEFTSVQCKSCGKNVGYKKENYIKL